MPTEPKHRPPAPPPIGESPLPRVDYVFACEATPEQLWRVRRVSLTEALSQPYELTLDLLSEGADINADALLATNCELIILRQGVARSVCGIVAKVELHDRCEDQQPVRLTVVPALRLLEQRIDTRLWQDLSAVAVVEEVLTAAFSDYEREVDSSRLSENYATREYIVQYNESDFDFVSRLLEDEGVAYHFDHERQTGREVLVLEDTPDHWAEVPTLDDSPTLHVIATREDQAEVESIQRLSWARAMRPNSAVRRTFDWLTPTKPSSAQIEETQAGGPTREVYSHGRIVEIDPEPRVVRELAHARAGSRVLRGVSNLTGMLPGRRFRVAASTDRPELEHDSFLVTRSSVHGDCPEVQLGEAGGSSEYVNEFECVVLDKAPWRPPLRSPLPKIYGPQTALVTGPDGEEIHVDEHGRVKVRFDWDRQHALTDDTSMWIRVAQGWAGGGFGVLFIPRVGMEVVVEFISGDPDRPLVTGCVYNGESMSSVPLPDSKTQSTIRTQSSPGGEGYNELRFEDAAGAEEIFVHAQRNLREQIGRDSTTQVGANRSETIQGNHSQTVHGDQTLVVDGTRTETARGEETVTNEKSRATTVYGEELLEVYDLTTTLHHRSLERRITGHDETLVRAPEAGVARSRTEVEGDLDYQIKNTAKLIAGDRVEIVQGAPASRVQAIFADGNLGLDAEQAWRATSGTCAELLAGSCLKLEGTELAELRQGRASIRIHNDAVVIDAREIRFIVGDNEFLLSETGLCCEAASVSMTALAAITLNGASVDID